MTHQQRVIRCVELLAALEQAGDLSGRSLDHISELRGHLAGYSRLALANAQRNHKRLVRRRKNKTTEDME